MILEPLTRHGCCERRLDQPKIGPGSVPFRARRASSAPEIKEDGFMAAGACKQTAAIAMGTLAVWMVVNCNPETEGCAEWSEWKCEVDR